MILKYKTSVQKYSDKIKRQGLGQKVKHVKPSVTGTLLMKYKFTCMFLKKMD